MTDKSDKSDKSPLSRRELLRGRFLGGLIERAQETVNETLGSLSRKSSTELGGDRPHESPRYRKSFPILRPPGAIEEDAFLDGCTKCDACVQACPHDAIVHAPIRFRRAAGTPMIDAASAPCRMCEDFPCIAACEPNVLRMDMPKMMGVARIDRHTCLAHQNSFCTVCSEQCPVEGAIEVVNGKPRIVEDKCTGCGVCHHVCPAPANAVLLMPVSERPLPPEHPNASARHEDVDHD